MTAISLHPLAGDYLERVRRAGQGVPARERLRELLVDIRRTFFAEAIDPEASSAEALTVLDRLGEPEEIIAAERPDATVSADGRGTGEWAAIFLLLLGGFVFGLGWIVGLILLWSSRAWSTMDKLIGTVVIPGGLAASVYVLLLYRVPASRSISHCWSVGGPTHCISGPSSGPSAFAVAALLVVGVSPIFTAIYLARRAR